MFAHRLGVAALATTLLATPAAAQRTGTVEVAALLRGTLFDPSFKPVSNTLGPGGRAGVYLGEQWLIEADISTSSANSLASYAKASYRPFHARVNFLTPYSDRGKAVVGLGVVATHYGGDFGKNDAGLASLFGLCLDLRHSLVGRVDFTMDFVPSPANGAGNNWIAGMQIGVGYRFGQ